LRRIYSIKVEEDLSSINKPIALNEPYGKKKKKESSMIYIIVIASCELD
jgi:hypothetical protein